MRADGDRLHPNANLLEEAIMLTITGHGWLAGTAVGLGILGLVFVASLSIVLPVFQFPPPTEPYAT